MCASLQCRSSERPFGSDTNLDTNPYEQRRTRTMTRQEKCAYLQEFLNIGKQPQYPRPAIPLNGVSRFESLLRSGNCVFAGQTWKQRSSPRVLLVQVTPTCTPTQPGRAFFRTGILHRDGPAAHAWHYVPVGVEGYKMFHKTQPEHRSAAGGL